MTALLDQVTRAQRALDDCTHRASSGGPTRVCVRCTERARQHLRNALQMLPNADPSSSVIAIIAAHPGFFHLERLHGGHNGECPAKPFTDEHGLRVCWHWRVGVAGRPGRVSWFEGWTAEAACESARLAIAGTAA